MDELLAQFLIEGPDLVADAHRALEALGRDRADYGALDALFRATHTLKGSVALFDMAPAEQLLHSAETCLESARKHRVALEGAGLEALIAAIDQVDRWIEALGSAGALPPDAAAISGQLIQALSVGEGSVADSPSPQVAEWLAALRARPECLALFPEGVGTAFRYTPDPECFFRGDDPLALIAAVPDLRWLGIVPQGGWPAIDAIDPFRCIVAIEGLSGADADQVRPAFRFVPDQVELAPLDNARRATAPVAGDGRASSLRVDGGKLDRLAREAGELAVAVHSLDGLAGRVERLDRALGADLRRAESAIAQASGAIRATVSNIRLVALGPVLRRMPRLARELAVGLGKDIDFAMTGETTEADKLIADALFEPLLHLVRNAIDHGIEPAAEREAAGKPAKGRVSLTVSVAGDRLVVTLSDDGRGIDPERVRASAVGKGLLSIDDAVALSDAQARRLIFLAGFSTADSISSVSGRGVGMDAVQRAIERLQGTIEVDSTVGSGSTFRISLPVSAITTRLLTVFAGEIVYGVRLDQIVETLRIDVDAVHKVGQGEACVVRDRTIPVIDLGSLLGRPGERGDVVRLIVTEVTGEPVALRVDALGDRLDALVHERAGLLASVPAIGGTSVLADGGVLLVLDLPELLS